MVGDRYQYNDLVFEVTSEFDGKYDILCVDGHGTLGWHTGETTYIHNWDGWTYLGNFSKSNRFKEIYDILNS